MKSKKMLHSTNSVTPPEENVHAWNWVSYIIMLVLILAMGSCSDSSVTSSEVDDEPETPPTEEPPVIQDLSEVVDSVRIEYNMPAMGAALVSIEKGITIGVAGERRFGSGISVEEDDHWSWGSNTKAITGLVTAKAVDMGLIEWNQTLEELFPEYVDIMRDQYKSVTTTDLLGHRAGFVNQLISGLDGQPLGNGVTPQSQRMEMLEWVLQQDPHNAIGQYYYSNLGFSALGLILEQAFDMPYEEWAVENLSDSFDLNGFGFGPQDEKGTTNQPVSHRYTDGEWVALEAHENTPFRRPSGGAHGSLEDWGKIIIEMMKAENGTSDYITPEAAAVLSSIKTEMPGGSEYSSGWIHVGSREWAEGEAWLHTGSNGANYSIAWVGPGAGVAFLVVINARDTDGVTVEAANTMISELLNYWQEMNE
ncbi:MAG: serine hydrolase [Bacteroidetes bacterium]|nr:serine hydrolase [Bacteroidota bacterium]